MVFSIEDVVGVLTDSPDYNTGRKYWNKLKQRLKDEGNELVTNCHQLKCGRRTVKPPHGRCRHRAASAHHPVHSLQESRAVQGVAGDGRPERIEETIDPEQAIDRALETYLKRAIPRNGYISGCLPSAFATS